MKWLMAIALCALTCTRLFSQQFGGNLPSVRWKQINTDSARIIFPIGLDSAAQQISNVVHYLAAQKPVSLGDRLKKIDIVLQNQTTIPNGYVGLGPLRSEFFLTPFLNNFDEGSISWPDLLALHEYRHVQQFNNFHHGLSKLMYYLFGEEGYALAINAAIPGWFFEGDAVYQETTQSAQGRGRLPLFTNAYPALWLAGKDYSWMKLRNGSLKDYVPNHYYLGYLLVNYGREKYGADFWTKVTADASAFRGLIYPFQRAIKKYAGVDYKTFRKEAFAYYKNQLTQQKRADEDYVVKPNQNFVTNYYYPQRSGHQLVYQKNSYRHRPAFYLRDSTGERKLKVRDISLDEQFSYRAGKIAYAAYARNPRWNWQDYSVIKLIDTKTKQEKKLTSRSKYFVPDLSPDGSKVATVHIDPSGRSAIHVLDANNGSIIKNIHSNEILLFTDPKFVDEHTLVTAVRLKDGRMALALAETETGNLTRLTPPSFNVIGNPSPADSIIFFTASFGGNDDVFALRLSDQTIRQVTHSSLGNYFVHAAQNKLVWSTFTAEGYQLREQAIVPENWQVVAPATIDSLSSRFPVAGGAEIGNILANLPDRVFAVTDYKKTTGLFNFHSWRPYYSDPIFSFSIYGENVLNTLQTEIYYLHHLDEKTNAIGFNAVYGALFSHIAVGSEFTFDRQDEIGSRIRHWSQLDTYIGLRVPLSFASGKSFRNFRIASHYVLRNEFNKGFYKDSIGNSQFGYLQHFLSWAQQVPLAAQHIYPRLGYGISLNHRHAITKYTGYQFMGAGNIFLPGFLSTHSIVLTGAFQQVDTLNDVIFSNRFSYSRGFTAGYFTRMWRLSGNYHFPLLYPDWGFANILYFQRFRTNLFYDFTKIYSRDKTITRDQASMGVELFTDTRWWNEYPLSFGIRISRLLNPDQITGKKGTYFEFILPVSIIPR